MCAPVEPLLWGVPISSRCWIGRHPENRYCTAKIPRPARVRINREHAASPMNAVIITSARLLGDGLSHCLNGRADIRVLAVVDSLTALRQWVAAEHLDIVLIDVMQEIDLDEVRSIALERPHLPLMALGLREQRNEVICCGRAGFADYVVRDATVENLCQRMSDVVESRLSRPAELSGSLPRTLFCEWIRHWLRRPTRRH